jgi:hypothetical protein
MPDTKIPALLTSNPKTDKSRAYGYLTAVQHLAPAFLSGRNVCPHATPGCRAACLNTSGRGGGLTPSELTMVLGHATGVDRSGPADLDTLQNAQQRARIALTLQWHSDRPAYFAQLVRELAAHERRCKREGLAPADRLNGTSDIPWERFPVDRGGERYAHVFAAFPAVRFYDYTKWPVRLRRIAGIENYSLTFSLAETAKSRAHALDALAAGVNVAAVFRVESRPSNLPKLPLPADFLGFPVIDGDTHDLRFLDAVTCIVGLRSKGHALADRSGFVQDPER